MEKSMDQWRAVPINLGKTGDFRPPPSDHGIAPGQNPSLTAGLRATAAVLPKETEAILQLGQKA